MLCLILLFLNLLVEVRGLVGEFEWNTNETLVLQGGASLQDGEITLRGGFNQINSAVAMYKFPLIMNENTAACTPKPFKTEFTFTRPENFTYDDGFAFILSPQAKWYDGMGAIYGYVAPNRLGAQISFSQSQSILQLNSYSLSADLTIDWSEPVYYVWVEYDSSQKFSIFFNNNSSKPSEPILNATYNVCEVLNNVDVSSLYVGFSSTLQSIDEVVNISYWNFTQGDFDFEFEKALNLPTKNDDLNETSLFTIPFTDLNFYGNSSIQEDESIAINGYGDTGAVMYKETVKILTSITNGTCTPHDFQTSFTFQMITNPAYCFGDGMTFIISPLEKWPLLGGSFFGYCYPQLPSLVVEFDTYQNNYDPDNNHMGINIDGSLKSQFTTTLPFRDRLMNGNNKSVQINYNSTSKTLTVSLTSQGRTSTMNASIDTCGLFESLSQEYFYIGFTGASGGCVQKNVIVGNWTWQMNKPSLNDQTQNQTQISYSSNGISKVVVIVIVVVSISITILLLLFIYFFCRKVDSKLTTSLRSQMPEKIDYATLCNCTNYFSDENIIGKGGFGSVYKGISKEGQAWAIKKMNNTNSERTEFEKELKCLWSLRHNQVLKLIGYCERNNEVILVFPFISNGSLEKRLTPTFQPPLTFEQRLQIAIDVAKGLEYLHHSLDPPIIHRDIKPANVLLDEKLKAIVGDFGLVRSADVSTQTVKQAGTLGYMDSYDLFQTTTKSDVYSYGVVLLELFSGKPLIQTNPTDGHKIHLKEYVRKMYSEENFSEIVHPDLREMHQDDCISIIEFALICTYKTLENRPSMGQVIATLSRFQQHAMPTVPDDLIAADPNRMTLLQDMASFDMESTTSFYNSMKNPFTRLR